MARRTGFFLARESGLMIGLYIEIRTPQTPTAPAPSLLSVSAAALRFLSVSTLRAEKAASQGSLPTQQTGCGLRTADCERQPFPSEERCTSNRLRQTSNIKLPFLSLPTDHYLFSSNYLFPLKKQACHQTGLLVLPGYLSVVFFSLRMTSWAPPSTMDVAETRVILAFCCSSGMVRAPQLHMVDLILLVVFSTFSLSGPA